MTEDTRVEAAAPAPVDDHAGHDHAGHDHAGHAHGDGESARPKSSTSVTHALAAPLHQAKVEDVEEAMKDVVDPEIGINIVDLGLVYGVHVDDDNIATLDMTLTSAACPLTDVIEDQTRAALDGIVAGHRINWVWMPPWGTDKITEDGRDQMRALGFNV